MRGNMYSNQSLDHAMCTATELEESSTLPPAAITTLYMYIQKGSYYYIAGLLAAVSPSTFFHSFVMPASPAGIPAGWNNTISISYAQSHDFQPIMFLNPVNRAQLEITGDYWRLLEITGDYWRSLEITGKC